MKRVLTENIMNGLRNLKHSLSPRLLTENLSLQLKNYEVSKEFLEEFLDYLDMNEVCKASLDPDCILYLMENNKFDYDIWVKNVDHKNIDILVNDDFIVTYNVDLEDILSKSKLITSNIYNKYINSESSKIRKNILLNYDGPEVTLSKIMDNIDILDNDLFKISKINQEIKSYNSEVQDRILNTNKELNPLVLLGLMQKVYIQNEVNETIDNLNFKELDLTENNPNASQLILDAQNLLSNIVEKYSEEVVEKLLKMIFFNMQPVLFNSNLLRKILVSCDNLAEDVLYLISSVFIMTNTRKELLNYAKNHKYETLVAAIALQD